MTFLLTISFILLLYVARFRILNRIGSLLVTRDAEHSNPDAIVLMNGNISTRPFEAARVYEKYRAPILLARLPDTQEVKMGIIPNISDATVELLTQKNVPGDAINLLQSEHWVAGTWNEAILICDHIRIKNYKNITIITDAFHTRRAQWTFRKVMRNPDIDFRCLATPYSVRFTKNWWRSEHGLVHGFLEFIKFFHYFRLEKSTRGKPLNETDLPIASEVRDIVQGKSDT